MTDKLTKKQEKVLSEMYSDLEAMVDDLEALGPINREFSIFRTKLEEGEMWCERGFETMGYEPAEDDDDDGEDGEDGEDSDSEEAEDDNKEADGDA